MSLKDLEKSIYKQEGGSETQKAEVPKAERLLEEESGPFEPTFFGAERENKSEIWLKEDEEKRERKKKIKKTILITGLALVIVSALVGGAIFIRRSAFSEDKVTVSLFGPERVQSGELAVISIEYKNDNRASLRDVVLHINYAENFKLEENLALEPEGPNASRYNIGTLKGKSNGKIEIRGKFFGTKDLITYVSAKLEYSSSNFNSRFAAEERQAVLIASSPLFIEATGPQSVYSGGAVSFILKYRNEGQQTFRNLKLKITFPPDFSFGNSEPLPARGTDVWYIGDLEAGQEGEVRISGIQEGQLQQVKQYKFSLGDFGSDDSFVAYNELTKDVKIVGTALAITQTINDKKGALFVNAGERLLFQIKFKNTSEVALTDLILTEQISSPVIDYASFRNEENSRGSLDSATGTVTWKSTGVEKLKSLRPGEEGVVSFSVKLKDTIPISSAKDKNFSFVAVCRMDSPDIPTPEGENKTIFGNGITVKVNSKIIVTQSGFYNDHQIPNSGPIPPQVGQETTFTMRIKAENISNDITNVKIVVRLSPGVEWKNNFLPSDASVEYNDRTNEVIWNIGSLPAGIGIITDPRELAFQIAVKPSSNLVGNYVPLLEETVFTADDSFTGQKLEARLGEKNSSLTEDISVGDEGGKVIP